MSARGRSLSTNFPTPLDAAYSEAVEDLPSTVENNPHGRENLKLFLELLGVKRLLTVDALRQLLREHIGFLDKILAFFLKGTNAAVACAFKFFRIEDCGCWLVGERRVNGEPTSAKRKRGFRSRVVLGLS